MTAIHWCDGSGKKYRPRLIHDINTCCLLVNRVYKCGNDHEVLGSYPDILSKFAAVGVSSLVPFILYHKTGFTRAFMMFVTSTLNSAITLLELEKLLIQNSHTISENSNILHKTRTLAAFLTLNQKKLHFGITTQQGILYVHAIC